MRVSKLKLGIVSGVALVVVGSGIALAYVSNQHEKTSTIATQPVYEEVLPTETTLATEPLAEIVAEPVAPTAAEPSPQPATVRSFEEIVLDYPNMSTGAPGFPECAGYLKNAFPERFQDSNREESIKWVSEKFINVCAAIDLKANRVDMVTLRHFWGQ